MDMRDAAPPKIPGPDAMDVRAATVASRAAVVSVEAANDRGDEIDVGSNAWAVAGRFTATGSAIVASGMHLPLTVPPTWYRARLRIAGPGVARGSRLDLEGLTVPGTPVLVAGSNGHVAWAFTNSDGDWLDARPVACLSIGRSSMRTPAGDVPLTTGIERIRVRGRPDDLLPVTTSAQGILFAVDPAERRCWFASWLAERPAATNMNLLALEGATSVEQVLALAPSIGIPEQNLVAGDAVGNIGWTIAGRLPMRASGVGTAPPSWLPAADTPRIYDPPLGRLWTANARATDDPIALEAIGGDDAAVGAQYDLGARARQIRDALLALERPARVRDMLRIQLDDRALFLARWRRLILELLDPAALAGHPRRAEMRRLVASWDARADVDSVGYRLVRAYHATTSSAVWHMILAALAVQSNEPAPQQFERPLWALVTQRPLHMLAARSPGVDGAPPTPCTSSIRCRARCRFSRD
jgi:penicillin G amidase